MSDYSELIRSLKAAAGGFADIAKDLAGAAGDKARDLAGGAGGVNGAEQPAGGVVDDHDFLA